MLIRKVAFTWSLFLSVFSKTFFIRYDFAAIPRLPSTVFYRPCSTLKFCAAAALSLCVVGVAYGQTDSPAVSGDGQTVVVGKPGEEQVLFYVRDEENKQWIEQEPFVAADRTSGDLFGSRVAINYVGDLVAVGAPGRNSSEGAVYIFTRNNEGDWAQSAILVAGNADEGDEFGSSVALDDDGEWLAAGAPGEASREQASTSIENQTNNGAPGAGAVYTFTLDIGADKWTATTYLKAISLDNQRKNDFIDAGDRFGHSVALSGDGRVLAVGVPFEDSDPGSDGAYEGATERDNGSADSGMVMVFERYGTHEPPGQVSTENTDWTLDYFFKATNVGAGDLFGTSVALDNRGYILAVGAPGEDNDGAGVEYLAVSDEAEPAYIDLHDGDDEDAVDSGAVYIYHYQREFDVFTENSEDTIRVGDAVITFESESAPVWQSAGYIKSPNSGTGDEFGSGVALNGAGNVLAVGAIGEDADLSGVHSDTSESNNNGDEVGAVYLYRGYGDNHWVDIDHCRETISQESALIFCLSTSDRSAAYRTLSWDFSAYVKPPAASGWAAYGSAVALSDGGGTLAAGSEGDFDRISDIDELAGIPKDVETVSRVVNDSLVAPDSYEVGQGSEAAISADGSVMAVGDRWANSTEGEVYIYTKDSAGEWASGQTLSASNAGADDAFGASVAISDNGKLILIGAPGEDGSGTGIADSDGLSADDAATDAGALYIFELNPASNQWEEVWYVKAGDAEAGDRFGHSVAISNDGGTYVVGAIGESDATGAAYVFTTANSTQWIEDERLVGEGVGDQFGYSVAVSGDGDTVSVGAPYDDGCAYDDKIDRTSCEDSGAVYVWGRQTRIAALGEWAELAYVKSVRGVPPTGDLEAQSYQRFGHSVSMSDDGQVLAVGAPYWDERRIQNDAVITEAIGEVSVFQWIYLPYHDHENFQRYFPVAKISVPEGQSDTHFGSSVALSDDGLLLAVGAVGDSVASTGIDPIEQEGSGSTEVGVVQIWQYGADKEWELLTTIKPPVADLEGRFGDSAAFSRSGEGLSLAIGGASVAVVMSGPILEKRTSAVRGELSLDAMPLSVELDQEETAELEVMIGGFRARDQVTLTAAVSDEDVVAAQVVSTSRVTLSGMSAGATTVTLTASGVGYSAVTAAVEVTVMPVELSVEPNVVTVAEGDSADVQVSLTGVSEDATVTVTIVGSEEVVSTLLLSASENHRATFTVETVDDDVAEIDETIEYEFSVVGYEEEAGVIMVRLAVTVTDDDTVVLSVEPNVVTVAEGDSADVQVSLTGVSEDATVTVTIVGSEEVVSTLLLSASENHRATFTVETVDDDVAEIDETIEYEFSVVGYEEEAGAMVRLVVTVIDNDTAEPEKLIFRIKVFLEGAQ